MTEANPSISVRHTEPRDIKGIVELCQRVYPDTPPWRPEQLHSHLRFFPEGQFVAVQGSEQWVVGMAAARGDVEGTAFVHSCRSASWGRWQLTRVGSMPHPEGATATFG